MLPAALLLLAGCGGLDVPPRGPLARHDLAFTSLDWVSAREGIAGKDELRLLRTDGSVDVLVHARPDGTISDASWSPDGTRLAYSVTLDDPGSGGQRSRLERVQPGGSPETLADLEGGSVLSPSWSPDGKRLLAILQTSPSSATSGLPRVLLLDARGGNARLLSPPDVDAAAPRWSRDGRLALYLAKGSHELRAQDVDSGESRVIAAEPVFVTIDSFAMAPDVDRVLVSTYQRTYTVDLDGNDLREIGQGWGAAFEYSPGGDLLAFLRTVEDDQWLFVSTASGQDIHAVARFPVKGRFAWAGVGSWLAFSTAQGKIEIRSASGDEVIEVTRGDRFDLDPAWRP